ncbi:putative membrane protein, partial [Chlamydia psittaci 06-1683]
SRESTYLSRNSCYSCF